MFKRYIDYRVVTEHDPSGTDKYYYILEVQHKFIWKYWMPVMVSSNIKDVVKETRRLIKKHKK